MVQSLFLFYSVPHDVHTKLCRCGTPAHPPLSDPPPEHFSPRNGKVTAGCVEISSEEKPRCPHIINYSKLPRGRYTQYTLVGMANGMSTFDFMSMFLPRECQLLQRRERMALEPGHSISMGLVGRTEMDIGNGWVEHIRPDGKRFYVNNDTGKRTWVRPKEEGVMVKSEFDRCEGLVSKMTYNGRFPMGMEATVADAGDCQAFLQRLYSANETKWRHANEPNVAAPTPLGTPFPQMTPFLNSEERYMPMHK